jgi:cell division protein DivIC
MSKRLGIIWNYLAHYKYLIVIVVGVLVVGVIDDNSIRQHIRYQIQIAGLRSEIDKYNAQLEKDTRLLKEMRKGPQIFGKIARERYFMKADNEDIFVLSSDIPDEPEEEDNQENAK